MTDVLLPTASVPRYPLAERKATLDALFGAYRLLTNHGWTPCDLAHRESPTDPFSASAALRRTLSIRYGDTCDAWDMAAEALVEAYTCTWGEEMFEEFDELPIGEQLEEVSIRFGRLRDALSWFETAITDIAARAV